MRSYKYNRALRYWTLERCGIKTKGAETYYICNQHEVERIMKPLKFKRNGGVRMESHEFEVPKPIGMKYVKLNTSKGVGIDRELASMEKKIAGDIEKKFYDEDNKDLVHLAVDNAKLAFQSFNDADEVARNLSTEFSNSVHQIRKEYENKKVTHCIVKDEPTVLYAELSDAEVKRRTGFESKVMMMAMIIISCNGDHDQMICTVTSLTWFEEWLMYYEILWGKTTICRVDVEK